MPPVATFLTDDWIDAFAVAASKASADLSVNLAVRQIVDDVSWTVRLADGHVTVDRDPDADVTLTTDRATAAALVRGELAATDALATGRLRLGGDLARLLAAADGLVGLDAAYAEVRADTTFS